MVEKMWVMLARLKRLLIDRKSQLHWWWAEQLFLGVLNHSNLFGKRFDLLTRSVSPANESTDRFTCSSPLLHSAYLWNKFIIYFKWTVWMGQYYAVWFLDRTARRVSFECAVKLWCSSKKRQKTSSEPKSVSDDNRTFLCHSPQINNTNTACCSMYVCCKFLFSVCLVVSFLINFDAMLPLVGGGGMFYWLGLFDKVKVGQST